MSRDHAIAFQPGQKNERLCLKKKKKKEKKRKKILSKWIKELNVRPETETTRRKHSINIS